MGDIGALAAPRGLLIETGDKDPLNGLGGLQHVKTQLEVAKKAYAITENKLSFIITEAQQEDDILLCFLIRKVEIGRSALAGGDPIITESLADSSI